MCSAQQRKALHHFSCLTDHRTAVSGGFHFFSETFWYVVRAIAPLSSWSRHLATGLRMASCFTSRRHGIMELHLCHSSSFVVSSVLLAGLVPDCGGGAWGMSVWPGDGPCLPGPGTVALWHGPRWGFQGFQVIPAFPLNPVSAGWWGKWKLWDLPCWWRVSRLPAGRVAELDFALVKVSCLLVFIFLCDKNHPGFHCLPPCTISLLSLVFRQCHLFSFESLC